MLVECRFCLEELEVEEGDQQQHQQQQQTSLDDVDQPLEKVSSSSSTQCQYMEFTPIRVYNLSPSQLHYCVVKLQRRGVLKNLPPIYSHNDFSRSSYFVLLIIMGTLSMLMLPSTLPTQQLLQPQQHYILQSPHHHHHKSIVTTTTTMTTTSTTAGEVGGIGGGIGGGGGGMSVLSISTQHHHHPHILSFDNHSYSHRNSLLSTILKAPNHLIQDLFSSLPFKILNNNLKLTLDHFSIDNQNNQNQNQNNNNIEHNNIVYPSTSTTTTITNQLEYEMKTNIQCQIDNNGIGVLSKYHPLNCFKDKHQNNQNNQNNNNGLFKVEKEKNQFKFNNNQNNQNNNIPYILNLDHYNIPSNMNKSKNGLSMTTTTTTKTTTTHHHHHLLESVPISTNQSPLIDLFCNIIQIC
ncbi:hypothetical protein DFA_03048 [Cavenderia fasciculata]|uniref:Uncharacterized protein n=1 Tax=Cavenderia fasciculata TaxID=261658 RepID=F4PGH0_CACFS|nr:uncharacterized protein DFA_03048 [Cavenderia fasciculata]EGG24804.1 hypothetical protein DFA_03048 [Cavenderia fasciculata]|eukprot:XP_004362655.1 hypothetical protein DFA_03048 [Cavenderia fasciculata]